MISTRCIVCDSKLQNVVSISESKASVFFHYLTFSRSNFSCQSEIPKKVKIPFCPQCSPVLEELYNFHEQLESLRIKIQQVVTTVSCSIVKCESGKLSQSQLNYKDDLLLPEEEREFCHNLRKRVFNKYNPTLSLNAQDVDSHRKIIRENSPDDHNDIIDDNDIIDLSSPPPSPSGSQLIQNEPEVTTSVQKNPENENVVKPQTPALSKTVSQMMKESKAAKEKENKIRLPPPTTNEHNLVQQYFKKFPNQKIVMIKNKDSPHPHLRRIFLRQIGTPVVKPKGKGSKKKSSSSTRKKRSNVPKEKTLLSTNKPSTSELTQSEIESTETNCEVPPSSSSPDNNIRQSVSPGKTIIKFKNISHQSAPQNTSEVIQNQINPIVTNSTTTTTTNGENPVPTSGRNRRKQQISIVRNDIPSVEFVEPQTDPPPIPPPTVVTNPVPPHSFTPYKYFQKTEEGKYTYYSRKWSCTEVEEGGYKCVVCSEILMEPKEMAGHLREHRQAFNTKRAEEQKNRPPKFRPVENPDGIFTYADKWSFIRVEGGFKCEHCPKIGNKMSILVNHIKHVHIKEKTVSLPNSKRVTRCDDGTYMYKRGDGETDKQWPFEIVEGERGLRCLTCRVYKPNYQAIVMHIKRFHIQQYVGHKGPVSNSLKLLGGKFWLDGKWPYERTEDNAYQCGTCTKRMAGPSAMREHIQSVHKGMTHRCHICAREFKKRRRLAEHMSRHENKRTFLCPQCGKSFNTNSALYLHKLAHRDKLICAVCGQKYSASTRGPHCRIDGQKKKSGTMHPCLICDREFNYYSGLYNHKKKHDKDRDFKCDQCPKSYVLDCELKAHLEFFDHEEEQIVVEIETSSPVRGSEDDNDHMEVESQVAVAELLTSLRD